MTFEELARFARINGLQLASATRQARRRAWGGWYAVFRKDSACMLYANDDLEQVRGFIAAHG